MEGATVKLIIKAPNQQIKDQVVNCDIGWSIGRLKDYLSEVYPNKPESASQKLIYSGQLLNDSSYLKDVLRQIDGQEEQAYTVHLVCAPQKTCVNKKTLEQIQPVEDTNLPSNTRSSTEHVRLSNTTNVQNQNQENNNLMQNTMPQIYSTQQYFDPRNSQQMAWMQQAYTHYFTQYMQLMAAQGIQLQRSIPYIQQTNVNTNETAQNQYMNNNNNNNNADDQPQPAAQEAAEVNVENNNAVGEEDAFNQDWLDFFYLLSRIIVLVSIVCFYSSLSRLLIVTFIGFAIYLYQGRFFRAQLILLPENNNGRADNNNQAVQNEAIGPQPVPQQPQQNEQVQTVQPEVRTNANEENGEERPGVLAFTWSFFSSFFVSLIPEQPNVI